MLSKRFVFKKNNDEGAICTGPDDLYNEHRGYGFVTQKNMPSEDALTVPDLCNNFTVPSYFGAEDITSVKQDENGCYVDSEEVCKRTGCETGRLVPLYFRFRVPRVGNYLVTLTLYGSGEVLVFAATRRLVFKGELTPGKPNVISFVQNVIEIIPRGRTMIHERRTIDVTILGAHATLSGMQIKQVNCPTLYICGDSTVTDQSADIPYAPGTSYSGWGQMLPVHFTTDIAVSNHAHSGLTTESFRTEGHYSVIQSHIRPGDYIMFQFAHNDQKLPHLKAYEGYWKKLGEYIREAHRSGAHPIIVTPLARNTWKADGSGYNDLLDEYARACLEIGAKYCVPVIDLHGFSMAEILRDGLEASKKYYFPKDYTHTNDYGAYKMAGFIADEIKKLNTESTANPYARLGGFVKKNTSPWTVDEIPVVPEVPEKYRSSEIPENRNDQLFADLERPDDMLKRAEALDMVIKTAHFFPTNVFNDLYEDIVGHEWYAGAVQCAYQNAIIPKDMVKDGRFRPEENVTTEDFVCFLMNSYRSRKGLPSIVDNPLEKQCSDYSTELVGAALALKLIDKNEDIKNTLTRKRAADMCRALNL